MAGIESLLRKEIERIASRSVRKLLAPLHKQVTTLRRANAALRVKLSVAERRFGAVGRFKAHRTRLPGP